MLARLFVNLSCRLSKTVGSLYKLLLSRASEFLMRGLSALCDSRKGGPSRSTSTAPIRSSMINTEYERRLKALQQEVSSAYLKGYEEARQRSQWTISAAVDESNRLRFALEEALVHVEEEAKIKILGAMRRSK